MTAYTVVLRLRAPTRPTQQPGSFPKVSQGDGNPSSVPGSGLSNQIMEDDTTQYSVQNVTAASKAAALAAAVTAYQTAWAATENARYAGTGSQIDLPGGTPVYTGALAPSIHDYIVLTGTATNP